MSLAKKRYTLRWRRSDKILEVRRGTATNFFEVFGGKDESSAALIQGRTLAGVLLDEVALMPRSFVEQALARCSVEGAKMWFSCNPGSPQHWFYLEWIKRHEEHNALYLHFTMQDNPGLSNKIIERYESMFSGVFYDRYIRGLWVLAEGRIYDMFRKEKHVSASPPGACVLYYISMDYGTQNPTAMQLWGKYGNTWYALREYYYSGRERKKQLTDEEYYTALENLAGPLPIRGVIVDPSAASMIACIRNHGRFLVFPADNAVLDGIRVTANALQDGKIKICKGCENTIREFDEYVWDEKAADRGEDRPLKINDHAMDAMRYFCMEVFGRHSPQFVSIGGK